jgi:hypothetical protein
VGGRGTSSAMGGRRTPSGAGGVDLEESVAEF